MNATVEDHIAYAREYRQASAALFNAGSGFRRIVSGQSSLFRKLANVVDEAPKYAARYWLDELQHHVHYGRRQVQ